MKVEDFNKSVQEEIDRRIEKAEKELVGQVTTDMLHIEEEVRFLKLTDHCICGHSFLVHGDNDGPCIICKDCTEFRDRGDWKNG